MPRAQIVLIGTIATTDIARETWKGSGRHREVTSAGKVYREVSFNTTLSRPVRRAAQEWSPSTRNRASCGYITQPLRFPTSELHLQYGVRMWISSGSQRERPCRAI